MGQLNETNLLLLLLVYGLGFGHEIKFCLCMVFCVDSLELLVLARLRFDKYRGLVPGRLKVDYYINETPLAIQDQGNSTYGSKDTISRNSISGTIRVGLRCGVYLEPVESPL